jgi:hypothetical protein
MKIVRRDSVDLTNLQECIDGPGYQLILERVQQMHRNAIGQLKSETEIGMVRDLQGQIRMLEVFLSLPSILHKEIRTKEAKRQNAAD